MALSDLKIAPRPDVGMDRKIHRKPWSPAGWSLTKKVGAVVGVTVVAIFVGVKFIAGGGERTLRVPRDQITIGKVEQAVFHDLIPLRAKVVPRDTIYIDAMDGGIVSRVLVQPGDLVQQGQPMIELNNSNVQLQVIQQESYLNQAISQLQQNEIALEQNDLANDRAAAEIDYNLVKLSRSANRRESLVVKGATSAEDRDVVTDELHYYQRLKPIQAESNKRQSALRDRLLPDIHAQLQNLRGNLAVVHDKLDGLIVRAPVTGHVTATDLKVGQGLTQGQRLAEVTPDTGMKLSAEIDEYYLARVRTGQIATVDLHGKDTKVTVQLVHPQVVDGHFTVDLAFDGAAPPDLVSGEAAQGRLQLGDDTPATILAVGPFLQQTGGDWVFVVSSDGKSAERRRIKVGRRTTEQLEILSGLTKGEEAITSDYTGLDRTDRIVLAR